MQMQRPASEVQRSPMGGSEHADRAGQPKETTTLTFPHLWLKALDDIDKELSDFIEAHRTCFLRDDEATPEREGPSPPSSLADKTIHLHLV